MATKPLGAIEPHVTIHPSIARVLSGFDREQLRAFISIGIELVDAMDGDPDLEDDDPDLEEDDPAGVHDEDGINTLLPNGTLAKAQGPGCPVADPGGCEHDGRENQDHY